MKNQAIPKAIRGNRCRAMKPPAAKNPKAAIAGSVVSDDDALGRGVVDEDIACKMGRAGGRNPKQAGAGIVESSLIVKHIRFGRIQPDVKTARIEDCTIVVFITAKPNIVG